MGGWVMVVAALLATSGCSARARRRPTVVVVVVLRPGTPAPQSDPPVHPGPTPTVIVPPLAIPDPPEEHPIPWPSTSDGEEPFPLPRRWEREEPSFQ